MLAAVRLEYGFYSYYSHNRGGGPMHTTRIPITSTRMMFSTTRRSQESGARDVVDSFTAPAIRKTFPESWIFENIEESQGYINHFYSNGLNC